MIEKTTILTAAILLLALLLSACGKTQSQTQEHRASDRTAIAQMAEDGKTFDPWDSDYTGAPITLRMLSISANPQIVKAVNDFNQQSRKYQIELESLFPYDQLLTASELDNAILKLNSQFISGDLPDIIDLYELPAEVYYSRGIIEDLMPYLQNDSEIQLEDYYENIIDAMKIDGGLPYVTNGVGFRTMIGPKELAGSKPGWTLAEMNAMLDEKGLDALGNLNGKVFINMMLYTHDFFVDWATGECRFTSDEFISMLETAYRIQAAQVDDIVVGEYEPHYVSFEGITIFIIWRSSWTITWAIWSSWGSRVKQVNFMPFSRNRGLRSAIPVRIRSAHGNSFVHYSPINRNPACFSPSNETHLSRLQKKSLPGKRTTGQTAMPISRSKNRTWLWYATLLNARIIRTVPMSPFKRSC